MKVVGMRGDTSALKAALEQLRRDVPDFIEHAKLMAKVKRASYLAYVEEGFTPEQALELTKGSMIL